MIVVDEASVVGDNVIVLQQEQGENILFQRVLLRTEYNLIEEKSF